MFKAANVGNTDRMLRFVVGAILIALPLLMPALELWSNSLFYYGAFVVGGMMILTATVRFCPAYLPLGLSTCERSKS
ncbi:MAG: DUF2892 domain-containing protein [Filomicrobium sp.]